jgi:hypothetical protein
VGGGRSGEFGMMGRLVFCLRPKFGLAPLSLKFWFRGVANSPARSLIRGICSQLHLVHSYCSNPTAHLSFPVSTCVDGWNLCFSSSKNDHFGAENQISIAFKELSLIIHLFWLHLAPRVCLHMDLPITYACECM